MSVETLEKMLATKCNTSAAAVKEPNILMERKLTPTDKTSTSTILEIAHVTHTTNLALSTHLVTKKLVANTAATKTTDRQRVMVISLTK